MTDVFEIFKSYNGTGYYGILFIGALIYLWFREEDRTNRALLVYIPAIIQLVFFVPYFYMIYNKLDEGTYYRILWLLPMTLVIAYSGCCIIATHTTAGILIMSLVIILSGTLVYLSPNIKIAENPYHLPEETIEICDMIMPEEGKERVWAAFPQGQVHFVRQYTTRIQLPFGRDSIVESWDRLENKMYDLYAVPQIRAGEFAETATYYYCHYVILEKTRSVLGDLDREGFVLIGETKEHYVYRNTNVEFFDGNEMGFYTPYEMY